MSRQFATNVTTIYDIFCPVPFLPPPFGFRRLIKGVKLDPLIKGVWVVRELEGTSSGKKKTQHKHKLFGSNFLRTFPTLTPRCPEVKKFLAITGPQEKPFLVRMSTMFDADVHDPKGFSKLLESTEKFALIFRSLHQEPRKGGF